MSSTRRKTSSWVAMSRSNPFPTNSLTTHRPLVASSAKPKPLRRAIEHNYCAYTALQTDRLVTTLRGTPEMGELLSEAKQCQSRFFGAGRPDFAVSIADPDIRFLKQAKPST